MSTFPNTYIQTGLSPSPRINYIVDNLLTPYLIPYRQAQVYDEVATLMNDGMSWKTVYNNWNPTAPFNVRKNKAPTYLNPAQVTSMDPILGAFQIGPVARGDNVLISYNFDYFGIGVLTGFIIKAVDIINSAGQGSATNYNIDTAPSNWDGVISDMALAECMEKLISDYNMWYGRLIFAIGATATDDGSGGSDIVSGLTTLKTNAEERAQKSLDNPRFKYPNVASLPTQYYYQAIRGFGNSSAHNIQNYGKTRGYKSNRYI